MSNIYQRGITIVDTEANLPSAASHPGFALIKSTNSIVTSNGTSWSDEVVTAITPPATISYADVKNNFTANSFDESLYIIFIQVISPI